MDKNFYKPQTKISDEISQNGESILIQNEKGEFQVLDSETNIMMGFFGGAAFISGEQHRADNNDLIETCFMVNYDKIKQLKSVTVKLMNFKNLMGILVFRGYDKKGLFVYEVPFDLGAGRYLHQLINLFHQDSLYFHIFREGAFYKTIIQDNPFKGLKEIETLLSRMSEKIFLVEPTIENSMEKMKIFYSEYSNEEISCFSKEDEAYMLLH